MINQLLSTPDTFQLIGPQVANILDTEQANQQALAIGQSQDPSLYALDVYLEDYAAYDDWEPDANGYYIPKVVVRYRDSNIMNVSSNNGSQYKYDGTWQIEIISKAESEDLIHADKLASDNLQNAIKLVRQIISAQQYRYLGFNISSGLIGRRYIQSININEPDRNYEGVSRIHGANLVLNVEYIEKGTQEAFEILDLIHIDVNRVEDSLKYFEALFQKGI